MTEMGRIRKNDTTEIVVQKTEYKGSVGIDVREYVTSERYTGWSKNGIRIPCEKWMDFKEILDRVESGTAVPKDDRERFEEEYRNWIRLMSRDAACRLAALPLKPGAKPSWRPTTGSGDPGAVFGPLSDATRSRPS